MTQNVTFLHGGNIAVVEVEEGYNVDLHKSVSIVYHYQLVKFIANNLKFITKFIDKFY